MHEENKGKLGILAISLIEVAKVSSDISFSFASQFDILAISLVRVADSHISLILILFRFDPNSIIRMSLFHCFLKISIYIVANHGEKIGNS